MKRMFACLLAILLLTGCAGNTVAEVTTASESFETVQNHRELAMPTPEISYVSRFDSVTTITLSDAGITVNGGPETDTVYTSHDIIYYEDRVSYESGNPYGEGEDTDRHTPEEAAAHTVVNITAPGAYRISGTLSAGQIRVNLGEDACEDPNAVAELILDNTDLTCTVAPAILFLNTYECDGNWSADSAKADVDTSTAGANLILEGENTVSGSHVARIYKDKEGEKKLWKQDGAVYSYMSLNVYGPGSLNLTADNEGLDTELHLTINGGNIAIRSDNDGINTNEDGVSVTTINAGTLHIIAGLGEEGDGIDSNGYLVINGGTVVASANPAADAGLDSDLGSYIHGGMVIALGSTMDWAESESDQVTMNLQFAQYQSSGSAILVTDENETAVFAYDPSEDEVLGENVRRYMGAILSCPNFAQGETYHVYLNGTISGEETGGIYSSVTGYANSVQMQYSGTDVGRGPGQFPGQMPEDFTPGEMPGGFNDQRPTLPEGETMPQDFDPGRFGDRGQRREEDRENMPQPGERPDLPEGETFPKGDHGNHDGMGPQSGEGRKKFYMADKVNAFSGVTAVTG